MTIGLVGRKVGMTRIFTDDGGTLPVTVLDVSDNRITQIKTPEKDGYAAVQVAFGKRRASRVVKPLAGHLAKAGVEAGHLLKEFRADAKELANLKVGGKLGVDMFKVGQKVDVQGVASPASSSATISPPTARRTATRSRTARPARPARTRARAACFPASAWRATWATSCARCRT